MNTAFVTPKSKKAKNRFANLMDSNEECIIEQNKGDRLFLTSANGKNHFWVNLTSDSDWIVELWISTSSTTFFMITLQECV